MSDNERSKRARPPGWREDEADESEEDAGFFDLFPEELADYKAHPSLVARKKPVSIKPLLKAAAGIAVLSLVVVAVILLWPSSKARVPDLVGQNLSKALEEAKAGGFKPVVKAWEHSLDHTDGVVLSQKPASDSEVKKGSKIDLTVSKGPPADEAKDSSLNPSSTDLQGGEDQAGVPAEKVVTIDPGHQALDAHTEWSDPGMTVRVPPDNGSKGVTTGNPEYLVTLDIGLKLKELLEKDGVNVVMTRETSTVDLTDISRAEIAGNASSDLYLRIHCGSSDDPELNGTRTIYPARVSWTDGFYEKSKTAAIYIQEALVLSCELNDLGITKGHDVPAFNWSRAPVVQAEVGFLTNPGDDELLSDEEFRSEVAWGLRNGVAKYLRSK